MSNVLIFEKKIEVIPFRLKGREEVFAIEKEFALSRRPVIEYHLESEIKFVGEVAKVFKQFKEYTFISNDKDLNKLILEVL
jgi:hypothetical protein